MISIRQGDEARAAFATYGAYFGTYRVKEKEGFVIHQVEGSLSPNFVGTDQKRFFEFTGDKLILRPPPVVVDGEQRTTRLTWERIE
jgi:hypothetical protein